MATQEYAASIQGVCIRVTRLDAAGNLLTGPGDSYITAGFMRVSFTPEYEEGDEITEKNANGAVFVTYKAPDTLKRITMELAIAEPDPELSALISGGLLLRKDVSGTDKSIGYASPGVGDDPSGNGVAVEAWSHAIKDGKKSSTLPYFHWVFPYAKLRLSGDRVIENGMLATTFEGYGLGNASFASGIDEKWEYPVAAERPYSYSRATYAPVGLTGFFTYDENKTPVAVTELDQGAEFNVTKKEIANNEAILTLEAAHGYTVGETVTVSGVDLTFNGTYTLTGVTTRTIKYAKTAADAAAVNVTDANALVSSKPSSSETQFNVPGSVNYNPEVGFDNVIRSSAD